MNLIPEIRNYFIAREVEKMYNANTRIAMLDLASTESLYRAAEKLPLNELKSKVNFYEERVEELEKMDGLLGILSRIFIGPPIILDNVHPLHGADNIYLAARSVLNHRKQKV